ncbi:MAG TPA: alpha/beta hydrolase-fold protein [Phycisphaerae bacterium]|nr:alpha/beta hydrolase-fold protein [Phycisphaerae bacterium]
MSGFPYLRSSTACLLIWFLNVAVASGATTTFRVEVPASTPVSDVIYIAGNFQGWNPGNPAYALTEQPDGRWQITLSLPDGNPIQYKFTRGNWQTVEKGPNGEEIPNRTYTPQGTETINHVVANWADIPPSTITGHVESFVYAPFLAGRRCWVYLPPDYFQSTARYPVLYMHDGQNLFDQFTSFAGEWRVDETCELLIGNREIEPIIVVGIENSAARCNEYTPWFSASQGCGGGGDVYLQAIRDVLIPEVDQRYRTRTGPANTYMAGSSLGGLITVYAGYAYDGVWGRIAGVSPSYWWANQAMLNYAAAGSKPETLTHFYQDMGTLESGLANLQAMRDIAVSQGFVEGEDFLSVEAQGHTHNEYYWALRLPNILRYLIDPPPIYPGDMNCDGDVDTANDLPLFIDALLDPTGYTSPPGCVIEQADMNGDQTCDGLDIADFVVAVLQ